MIIGTRDPSLVGGGVDGVEGVADESGRSSVEGNCNGPPPFISVDEGPLVLRANISSWRSST